MPDIKPGLYATMSTADYFADPCPLPSLSQSIAKILLNQSPAHARLAHPRLNPNYIQDEGKYEAATAIGNAAHTLTLGRGKPMAIFDAPDWNASGMGDGAKKKLAAERKAAEAAGKTVILRKHHDVAEAIRDAARPQLDLAGCPEAFRDGNAEVVMIAYDADYDIWLRSMCDWMTSLTLLYDLKTGMTSASPYAIPRRMVDQGWDVQAAMQERILDILDPDNRGRRRFRFVAIEDEPPYALTVNEMTESVMEFGRRKLRSACEIWRDCMKRNAWPAYPAVIYRPEYPGYAETQWMNREIAEADQPRWPALWQAPLDAPAIQAE